jgi:RNA polymerase sigma factor (sigma-70 family)
MSPHNANRRSSPNGSTQPRSERERERRLLAAARANDGAARDELVDEFMPLIGSVARIYRGSPDVGRIELMQEGVVGLLRALERYDASYELPFWAYASWWVRQAMQQLVAELGRPVVLSDRAARHLARVKGAQREYEQVHRREPSVAELSEATGIARTDIDKLLAAERRPRGLEEPVTGGDDSAATFGEQLADPSAEEDFERMPFRLGAEGIPDLMDCLTQRERTVVSGRFGLDGPERTLRDLGNALGVSAERVRQIEQRALDKLRG